MRIQTAPMPPTTDERTPVGQTVWTWACVLLIVGFHCFIQWRNFGPAHVEHDLDGYTWLAKRIATLGPLTVKPDNPFQYQSHVWVENAKGEVTAKYAPGHPIMMAIGYRLFGEEGIYYVSPVASALSLIGAFLLFRLWMGTIASLLALLTLSIHGMILFYGGYLLSHALDLCLVTWGMYFLWRWMEKPSFRWAVGAGLTLGYAVMVRHTNALLAACILAAIATALWRQLREQGQIRWRPVLALLGTYAIFPLVLAVYDTVLFGRPYITGYSLSDEQGAFTWGMLYGNYGSFMNNAFNNYLYVCLPLGGLGILMLGRWPEKLMRLLWVLPLTVLYASYYWYVPYGGFYRFLLSLTPVFIGMTFALLERVDVSAVGRYLGMTAVILLMGYNSYPSIPDVKNIWQGRTHLQHANGNSTVSRALSTMIQPDALIFTQGTPVTCVGMCRQYSLFDLQAFITKDRLKSFPEPKAYTVEELRRGRSAPRQQPSRMAFFHDFYAKTPPEKLAQMKLDLIRQALAAHRQVVFLLPENKAKQELKTLGDGFKPELIKEFPVDWWDWNYVLRPEKMQVYGLSLNGGEKPS